jgi:diadenosine tetraphosphate (Ap4A) HIT family hydrolase
MPTVLRVGPYRFFFYANDRVEPVHIHVGAGKATAKFWLDPVRLQRSRNFPRHELSQVQRVITHRREFFVRSWHEYFDG